MSNERFDKLENKLEKISEDIYEIRVVQAEQHIILKEHMRRTAANEKIVDRLTKLTYVVLGMLALGGAKSFGAIEKLMSILS